MAQLFRVLNGKDDANTWTFTFILPMAAVSAASYQDIASREFSYQGLKWRLYISKRDGLHLSPYVELLRPCRSLSCTLDIVMVLYNDESYTQNERLSLKRVEFSADNPRRGARTFVTLSELIARRGFGARELVLEVTMRNPLVVFATTFEMEVGTGGDQQRYYESRRFRFAEAEWSLVFCPNMHADRQQAPGSGQLHRKFTAAHDSSGAPQHQQQQQQMGSGNSYRNGSTSYRHTAQHCSRHLVRVKRHGAADMMTRMTYAFRMGHTSDMKGVAADSTDILRDAKVRVGDARRPTPKIYESPAVSELFDYGGAADGFLMDENYLDYVFYGTLHVELLLLDVRQVNQARVPVGQPSSSAGGPQRGQHTTSASVADADKQQWHIFAYFNMHNLCFNMLYTDLKLVPGDYTRYVCWRARVQHQPSYPNEPDGGAERRGRFTADYADQSIPAAQRRSSSALVPVPGPGQGLPQGIVRPSLALLTGAHQQQQQTELRGGAAASPPCVKSTSETANLGLMPVLEGFYCACMGLDKGVPMRTSVPTDQVFVSENPWVDIFDNKIVIEVEWIASYLLSKPHFSAFDTVLCKQILQMRRELEALQDENQCLEREVHNYQQTLAVHSVIGTNYGPTSAPPLFCHNQRDSLVDDRLDDSPLPTRSYRPAGGEQHHRHEQHATRHPAQQIIDGQQQQAGSNPMSISAGSEHSNNSNNASAAGSVPNDPAIVEHGFSTPQHHASTAAGGGGGATHAQPMRNGPHSQASPAAARRSQTPNPQLSYSKQTSHTAVTPKKSVQIRASSSGPASKGSTSSKLGIQQGHRGRKNSTGTQNIR